jgi:hypothetical protein
VNGGGGGRDSYVASGRHYDPAPQTCRCERPWIVDGETCSYCGRQLRATTERASAAGVRGSAPA